MDVQKCGQKSQKSGLAKKKGCPTTFTHKRAGSLTRVSATQESLEIMTLGVLIVKNLVRPSVHVGGSDTDLSVLVQLTGQDRHKSGLGNLEQALDLWGSQQDLLMLTMIM